eukprot:TRINITY_DN69747_c0_g1_i1.p1 TRINITY_DN69747_c0_g1~~TRINITY_DN69747_c0_g1_i1.p1  ORF type:complete len:382 (-),score=69.12 TRINITY_DN69747_c0_g1_i1:153-1298(-)
MGNSAVTCCASRDFGDDEQLRDLKARTSWVAVPEADEYLVFFDCEEGGDNEEHHFVLLKEPKTVRPGSFSVPLVKELNVVPEEDLANLPTPPTREKTGDLQELQFDEFVPIVTQNVVNTWQMQIKNRELDDELTQQIDKGGFPELIEWTTQKVVRRFLRAMCGDPKEATKKLIQAISCRVRLREMFSTMRCEVVFDVRVIGRDMQGRPTIYLCARNQKRGLSDCIQQLFLAFEAAVRISAPDGQAVLIADMYKANTRLNMDRKALTYLADNFGSVFADRLNSIVIIDFSAVLQVGWGLIKPFLMERTRNKINFCSVKAAKKMLENRFNQPTVERIISSFDINRDKSSTDVDREIHAQRTSICDVPLGQPPAHNANNESTRS